MKFNIKSRYPHEWQKHTIEEDSREFLVRNFEPTSLEDAVEVVRAVTGVVTEHHLQDQVQFSVDARRLLIFIHYSDGGPVEEPHYKLATAIDAELELS